MTAENLGVLLRKRAVGRPFTHFAARPKREPTPKRAVNAETEAAVKAFVAAGGKIRVLSSSAEPAIAPVLEAAELRLWHWNIARSQGQDMGQ
jgi:hypothetical protein